MQKPETAATNARPIGFDYRERSTDGDRGIEGVAAQLEYGNPGLGRQRMRGGDGTRRWPKPGEGRRA
jgi:hypothetical protein